jgi:hypothetical protein
MIYQDHSANSQNSDSVSMFSMHPPELVGVFQQTTAYIQCCYIGDKHISYELHKSLLSICENVLTAWKALIHANTKEKGINPKGWVGN